MVAYAMIRTDLWTAVHASFSDHVIKTWILMNYTLCPSWSQYKEIAISTRNIAVNQISVNPTPTGVGDEITLFFSVLVI